MPKVAISTKLFPRDSMENKIKVDNKPTASCSTETTNFENLLNECLVKNEQLPETNGKATSAKTMSIIADNLECSSSDSLTGEATNDQNIFSNNFTYKNPLFLQKRIDKYEDDLKMVIDEQDQIQNKINAQKEKTKASKAKKRKVKQMVEFCEIYEKPKMKIPKLIFERFMTDYEKEECSEELKQFAAEVNSRSADSYIFLRECLGNIFPPAIELPECSKEVRSDDLIKNDEDENMSADAEDQGHDEDPENVYPDDDEDEED